MPYDAFKPSKNIAYVGSEAGRGDVVEGEARPGKFQESIGGRGGRQWGGGAEWGALVWDQARRTSYVRVREVKGGKEERRKGGKEERRKGGKEERRKGGRSGRLFRDEEIRRW